MIFKVTDEGIVIKRLVSSRLIAYSDLKSIRLNGDSIVFTDKAGEETVLKTSLFYVYPYPEMYRAIKKYNIAYRNERDLKDVKRTYTDAEVSGVIARTLELVRQTAGASIRKNLGKDYEIELTVGDEIEYTVLHFRVVKPGDPGASDKEPFEDMVMSYLCEWDPATASGIYGVTVDLEDDELCREYVLGALEEYYSER